MLHKNLNILKSALYFKPGSQKTVIFNKVKDIHKNFHHNFSDLLIFKLQFKRFNFKFKRTKFAFMILGIVSFDEIAEEGFSNCNNLKRLFRGFSTANCLKLSDEG